MDTFTLTLPLAPSLNNAYVNVEGEGRRLTPLAAQFKADAAEQALLQALAAGWRYEPGQRLAITVTFWFESLKSIQPSDIDNRWKLTGDALAAGLGYNDNVVDDLHQLRGGIDPEDPRAEIELRVVPTPAWLLATPVKPRTRAGRAA